MKTTKKEFKEQVQLHILESLDYDNANHTKLALQNVVTNFTSWYDNYMQRVQPNKQQAFKEYLMCLPSDISVEFSNYEIKRTLENWFTSCGEEYKPKPNYNESDLYLNLIYREFCKLCTMHDVQF